MTFVAIGALRAITLKLHAELINGQKKSPGKLPPPPPPQTTECYDMAHV